MVGILLQFPIAAFSMLAGVFWMAAAYGHTVGAPWQPPQPVAPNERAEHQAKWNGRAAVSASIAAIFQAVFLLYQMGFPSIPHLPS